MLSITATVIYLCTAMLCLRAAVGRRAVANSVRQFWVAFACAFVVLAATRLLGVEEHMRDAFRAMLQFQGEYGQRRLWQLPLVVAFLLACAILATASVVRARRRAPWPIVTARWAGAVMVGLIILRLISLHSIDRLLYKGPHLNWVLDIGATGAVAVAAWYFRKQAPARGARSKSAERGAVGGE